MAGPVRKVRMRLAVFALAGLWVATGVFATGEQATSGQPPATTVLPAGAAQYRALVDQYCVSCHNDRLRTAGLVLQGVDLSELSANAEVWEKVIRKLRVGMMPPLGVPRPEAAVTQRFVSWLEEGLDNAPSARAYPGRHALHRLNRAEYANAIRDLLALDVDTSVLLPPDDASFGFDNIGDVLGVSPALQERYIDSAEKITALAVGDPRQPPLENVYSVRLDVTQTKHIAGLPFGTQGGGVWNINFPLDGEYELRARYWSTHLDIPRGVYTPHRLIITVDGRQVFEELVGTPEDQALAQADVSRSVTAINARLHVRVPITAGPHAIGVTFRKRSDVLWPTLLVPYAALLDFAEGEGLPQIGGLRVSGPFNATGPGDTPSRRKIFTCRPLQPRDEERCAIAILRALGRLAYRRPLAAADVEDLLAFYRRGRQERGFEYGVQMGLRRMLTSPDFVFRAERDPGAVAPGGFYRVSDLELASRLSFFLWSSIPDDELLTAASRGTLSQPAVLARQVERMLADDRAQALTTNFVGQWLYLRNLKSMLPNRLIYPDFDDNLRQSFQRETELLFESIVRENHNVVDLLTADYTFVDERLAAHYGIPNVNGTRFRRVRVTDPARRGLLGHGSILTVTSRADRTSPVLRGKFVLENLLGTQAPVPPPVVPPLPDNNVSKRPLTMRAQMEEHRANPACSSCHRLMDPIGFAMDHFDGIGASRTNDRGIDIDASGQLADGSPLNGVASLREALVRYQDVFVQTLTEKLMTYALGRGLEFRDMPSVRAIVRDARADGYRFSSVLMGIVRSPAFQMRMKELPDTPQRVAGQ
jgi:hypothetical protein